MLIRLVIENLFSFGERKEFSMLPNSRLKTLEHHKLDFQDIELLKLASIYGANGAGKSNLIKSLELFRDFIKQNISSSIIVANQFKFNSLGESIPQTMVIEFVQDGIPFYYGIQIENSFVKTEELYQSGLGKTEDVIIYERKTNANGITELRFSSEFDADPKTGILKEVLLTEFVKPGELVFKLLANREQSYFDTTKSAYKWFTDALTIITSNAQASALSLRMEKDNGFKSYAEELMCAFHVGIKSIKIEKTEINDFFGTNPDIDLPDIIAKMEEGKTFGMRTERGKELVLIKEDGGYFVKEVKLIHKGKNDIEKAFDLEDESDGTIRLLDFIPAFKDLASKKRVYFVDEIERSIHPLLIKELLQKFSEDEQSKGQLVFTTHESNLLDQNIFRQDEIWFTEKKVDGVTDIYSLSDFKEHKTIDIRKGYLTGRYGSIPFLGNLKDLNWHKYDINE